MLTLQSHWQSGTAQCTAAVGFFESHDPGPWLQAKTQQPIGVVGPVIIHVNGYREQQK